MLTRLQGDSWTIVCISPYTKLSYMFYAVNFVDLKVATLMDFYIVTNVIVIANVTFLGFLLGGHHSTHYLKNLFKELVVRLLRDT